MIHLSVGLLEMITSQLFTNISHDFRTPLTLMVGPLKRLIDDTDTDTKSQLKLQGIYRNVNILLQLINQLLDFRKSETGKLNLHASKQDIVEFVEDIRLTMPYTMSYEACKSVGDRETLFFLCPIDIDNEGITGTKLYTKDEVYAFAEKWPEALPDVYYTSVEHLQNSFIPSTATIH